MIDFFVSFIIFGFIISYFTGNITEEGFSLEGLPALIVFALVIGYFIIANKYLGGTLGKRIFRL